jgi:apolipoprotein D and lipocalin family protein
MRTGASLAVAVSVLLMACAHRPPSIPPVAQVDLERFMGDWYVIAHVPSRLERKAYNAVESYALQPDGTVQTTYQHRVGGFEEPLRTMRPVGYVRPDTGNAVWDMQFVWPFKAEYVIVHLQPDYAWTIIGRSKRDLAWIMARTPTMSEADYTTAMARLEALGYDLAQVRRVPQRWSHSGPNP